MAYKPIDIIDTKDGKKIATPMIDITANTDYKPIKTQDSKDGKYLATPVYVTNPSGGGGTATPNTAIEFAPTSGNISVTDSNGTVNSTNKLYGDTILIEDGGETIKSLMDNHILDTTTNPHNVTKEQIGLGNVDNTSDLLKPISTATQNALNLKLNISDYDSTYKGHSFISQDSTSITQTKGSILNPLFNPDMKIVIDGDNADEFEFNGHNIVFPKLDGFHGYSVDLRYRGTSTTGSSVTTRGYLVRSNEYVGTDQIVTSITDYRNRHTNTDPQTTVVDNSFTFQTNTSGKTDPFSVGGMNVLLENRCAGEVTITYLKLVITKTS